MKKILCFFIFLQIISFYSCDKYKTLDFYIENHCTESINVEIVTNRAREISENIGTLENKKVHSATTLKIYDYGLEEVGYEFKSILVTKEQDTAKNNFLDGNKWQMELQKNSDTNYYLKIYEEDFE
jgi:hypothetical protein